MRLLLLQRQRRRCYCPQLRDRDHHQPRRPLEVEDEVVAGETVKRHLPFHLELS